MSAKESDAHSPECDGNGRPDVFVATDTVRTFVFHDDDNEKFTESGLTVGVAFNEGGVVVSGMRVDFRNMDTVGSPTSSSRHSRMKYFRCIVASEGGGGGGGGGGRDLIGIGAAVTRRPLPHHRAYGSVHGGSRWLR